MKKSNEKTKIGFICDGETEVEVLNAENFKNLLLKLNLIIAGKPIIYKGKIKTPTETLQKRGAEIIVILTDKENYPCFTKVKERYINDIDINIHKIIVVNKMIESWFLADSGTMKELFQKAKIKNNTPIQNPENKGFSELISLFGTKYQDFSKPDFATEMNESGFSIENAAKHKQCKSAKYFYDYLKSLNENKIDEK
jgi:hypothetical protein